MLSFRPSGFILSPLWPRYLAGFALCFGAILGFFRMVFFDSLDPMHCHALLNTGTWLDDNWKNWQPDGCMLYTYTPEDSNKCLHPRNVVFVGDSITRKLFFQFANILDPDLPLAPPNDNEKHSDHSLQSSKGTEISFFWDPFLNSSHTIDLLKTDSHNARSKRPGLLVLGSGLWYLRYADTSGGVAAWQANVAHRVSTMMQQPTWPADLTVMLPVERVIPSKLTPDRAATILPSNIDAMNSDLYHRVHPISNSLNASWIGGPDVAVLPVTLPRVFNEMLDASQTEDGLHFNDGVVRAQANILLNLRCNHILPKVFPLNKTCCNRYPIPSLVHIFTLFLVIIWGPYVSLKMRQPGFGIRGIVSSAWKEDEYPALQLSAGALLIFIADRTDLWLKEQKQFNFWGFTFLSISCLAYGLLTLRRGDKDLGFLNRDQTDEWKGWMQLAILIYHYFGASKVSGIYNPIRVLVASYLFMTGFGHTTFYLRKADFSFTRVAQVLIRLNLLTVLLAYTMNTDYMFYYFAPLVSTWYLIVYATLFLGSQYNEGATFFLGKIILSASSVTWFFKAGWPVETLFRLLEDIFNIRWSAREWTFRVTLDLWIVYVGMLAAFAVFKIRERRLTDHPRWPVVVKVAAVVSAFILTWFFMFELGQESKYTYNGWHPYISSLPVLAFVVLRNANATLRSASSKAFVFVGKCSLELFIVQYHFWLAGDTKGVLLFIPGTKWRPVNFVVTSLGFVVLCHRIANATGEVTKILCVGPQTLPIVQVNGVPLALDRDGNGDVGNGAEAIPLMPSSDSGRKDMDGNPLPPEPDTPIRREPERGWVDIPVEGRSPTSPSARLGRFMNRMKWLRRLQGKVVILLCCMWILNVLWTYPE